MGYRCLWVGCWIDFVICGLPTWEVFALWAIGGLGFWDFVECWVFCGVGYLTVVYSFVFEVLLINWWVWGFRVC